MFGTSDGNRIPYTRQLVAVLLLFTLTMVFCTVRGVTGGPLFNAAWLAVAVAWLPIGLRPLINRQLMFAGIEHQMVVYKKGLLPSRPVAVKVLESTLVVLLLSSLAASAVQASSNAFLAWGMVVSAIAVLSPLVGLGTLLTHRMSGVVRASR